MDNQQKPSIHRLNNVEIDKLRDEVVRETATFIPYHIFEIVAEATMDACGIPREVNPLNNNEAQAEDKKT